MLCRPLSKDLDPAPSRETSRSLDTADSMLLICEHMQIYERKYEKENVDVINRIPKYIDFNFRTLQINENLMEDIFVKLSQTLIPEINNKRYFTDL